MKKMTLVLFASMISAMFVIGTALAVELDGKNAVSVFTSYTNSSSEVEGEDMGDQGQLIAQLAYSRFITALELKGSFTYFMSMPEEGDDSGAYIFALDANYCFGQSIFIPYVGLNVGFAAFTDDDDTNTGLSYGGQGGFKYFMSENVSANGELRYTMSEYDMEDVTVEQDELAFLLGISYYF